jgi:hypothetical protein
MSEFSFYKHVFSGKVKIKVKVKVKFTLEQATKAQRLSVEVQLYSFFNLELDGVVGQSHAPAALPPGKIRYPLYRRLGGPQGRSVRVRKISPVPGFKPGPSSTWRVAIPTEISRPTDRQGL